MNYTITNTLKPSCKENFWGATLVGVSIAATTMLLLALKVKSLPILTLISSGIASGAGGVGILHSFKQAPISKLKERVKRAFDPPNRKRFSPKFECLLKRFSSSFEEKPELSTFSKGSTSNPKKEGQDPLSKDPFVPL